MPDLPDFSQMSLDEITAYKVDLKTRLNDLLAEREAAHAHETALISQQSLDEARAQLQKLADANGRSLEDEAEWWQRRLTVDGDVGRWVQSNLVLGREAYEGIV